MPVCMALHSLIYPFEYCTFAPFLINDGEEEDINSLQQVSQPFTYFMGIAGSDYELVEKNILYDEYPSPVIIDLRDGSYNFTRVKKTHFEDFNRNPKKKEA